MEITNAPPPNLLLTTAVWANDVILFPRNLGATLDSPLPAQLPHPIHHQGLSVGSPEYILGLATTLPLCCHHKLPGVTFSGLGPWNSPYLVSTPPLWPSTNQSFTTSLSRLKAFRGSLLTASWITCKFLNSISRVTMCLMGEWQLLPAILVYLLIVPLSLAQAFQFGW